MNATQANHPTDPTLHAYGLGKLEDLLADAVNKHLESCPDCRRRVAELTSDSFLGGLREAQGGADSAAPDFSVSTGLSMDDGGASTEAADSAHTLPPGLANHPDYEILRELGRGGMGVVYLAQNRLMGRQEVLKVVSSHLVNRPGVMDRFLAEIRNAARLHHPNIVMAYSALRVEENLVLAMEYVEGLDLARTVKAKGPLSVVHACYFIHQAALGLQHAHELGMVHRDIKPSNLMLVRSGNRAVIKILDFGLAKVRRERPADGALTAAGQWLGTPEFIAPEQIHDARQADIRADIYSLGCTFYYLLTGRPPFQATNLYEIYQAHHSMDAPLVNLVRPDVPVELALLVATMMAKEPEQRFQTPKELAQALVPFLKKETPMSQPSKPEISRANATMTLPGADQAASQPARVVAQAPALSAAKPTPAGSGRDTLIEVQPEADLSEEVHTLGERRGVPTWLWPVAAAALLIIGVAVGWKLSIDSRSNTGDSVPPVAVVASTEKADPPATERKAIEATPAREEDPADPNPLTREAPHVKPRSPDVKVASNLDSESPGVNEGRQDDTNATAKEEPADTKPAQTPTPAKTQTPTQTADAPKAKADAEPSPEDSSPEAILLVKRGLKKEGRFYVIATEYEVLEGWRRVVPYWRRTEGAWAELSQAVEIDLYVRGLEETRINLQSYISNLNAQLRSIPNNPAYQLDRQSVQREIQAAQANVRAVNSEHAIAVKRRPSKAKIASLRNVFLKRRTEFFQESNKLKPVFDKVTQEYGELKQDDSVTNAIQVLKEQTKAPVSLGPSEFCRKAFTEVKEAQKMLSLDPDNYQGKKKTRLKQSPKGKTLSMPSK